jgi:predicted nucleotidyltransferase
MHSNIPIDLEKIAAFCIKWHITEFALFGSVVREDFRPDSDVDVLAAFAPDHRPTGLAVVRMERELSALFGRPVDLITRRGVEQSHNAQLRQEILHTAEVIYAQAA